MSKKINIASKPKRPRPENTDDWVEGRQKMKRLTIDVPENLHRRIKMTCAGKGAKMANEIREILEKEFPVTSS